MRRNSQIGSPQPLEHVTLNASASVYVMAISTTPSVEAGRTLVHELVKRRLIACGTVLAGATSIYRWNDAIQESERLGAETVRQRELDGRIGQ